MSASSSEQPLPLAVDLDGTLLKTDVLFEALAATLSRAPWLLLIAPILLLIGGRPLLKRMAADWAPLEPARLPYREDVLAWLRAEHARGRVLVLATAAARAPAEAIANHLGIFSSVFATDSVINLKSARKAEALAAAFPQGFVYAGDARADLKVWRRAKAAVLVDAAPDVRAEAAALAPIEREFPRVQSSPRLWTRALRVEHWLKNLLVFVAIPAAHQYAEPRAWIMALAGFVILNLIASSSYLLNDLVDLDADRAHNTKRNRPFAAGDLPLAAGLALAPAGLILGVIAAAILNGGFAQLAALYIVLTLSYSFALKRAQFIDVLVLGALFTLRVMMGAALIGVAVSPFLFLFSTFLFTSLALAKRTAELQGKALAGEQGAIGRGYAVSDLPLVRIAGAFVGASAVLLLVLYVSDPTPMAAFKLPIWLWTWPLLMIAWLTRIWLKCARGELSEDPLLFAARDRWSWAIGAALAATYTLASL